MMKNLALVTLLILVAAPIQGAEDRTLVGSIHHHGAFIAPVLKITEMQGQIALLAGGRLAWVANHKLALGVGGHGLLTDVKSDYFGPDTTALLNFGYGGVEIEYIFYPHHMFHFTIQTLIGGGGVGLYTRDSDITLDWKGDAFFIFEPGFNLEFNIREGWRFDFGYSYRFISDLKMEGLSSKDLRDVAAVLTLRLGKF